LKLVETFKKSNLPEEPILKKNKINFYFQAVLASFKFASVFS
jgi:hypothetical protein